MIRFISFLLGKPYEPCKSCETLKQELSFARAEKQELINTLINIVSPRVIEATTPVEINPINQSSMIFSRRRAALEERDRLAAATLKQSANVGRPDSTTVIASVDELEHELGIEKEA